MATSRRNFLRNGAICALVAGVPGAVSNIAKGNTMASPSISTENIPELTMRMFTPHINTTFRIETGAGAVSAKLLSAKDLKAGSRNPAKVAGRESFSLLFAASRETPLLPDSIYTIHHKALGTFSLFIASVKKPETRNYEAVVVRL